MTGVGFNASNYSSDWMSWWTTPYVHIFGDFFFAILLIVIAGGIYIGTDKNPLMTAIYCFFCAIVFGPIFNLWITCILLIITGLFFTSIAYEAFLEKRRPM